MKILVLHPITGSSPPLIPPRLAAALDAAYPPVGVSSLCQGIPVSADLIKRDFLSCYDQIVTSLDGSELASGDMVVIAGASSSVADWNAMEENAGWTTMAALLVLAFPEYRWIWNGSQPYGVGSTSAIDEWPLTDGSGLRAAIKGATLIRYKSESENCPFPIRHQCIAALDEEQDYAFFNAYTAYRFGYRAIAPLTWEETECLLKSSHTAVPVQVVLEDVFLQFADQPDGMDPPMSYLEARDLQLTALPSAKARVLVTSGGADRISNRGGERERQIRRYLQRLRGTGMHMAVIGKPLAGMFRLWTEAGMPRWLRQERMEWHRQNGTAFSTPGKYSAVRAPGFEWPPKNIDDEPGNHSAPGRLLMVARTLLERSGKLLVSGVQSVEEAVRGAVLASDALEMLGDRTPTTALEALAMKHQFEVLAECQFIGVRYNIEIKQRIVELRHEITVICRRFAKTERRAVALDAEVTILGKLVKVFQDHNQFDEELQCLYWQRRAMAKLLQARYGFFGWTFGWVWRYLNWLVRTPACFLLAIIGWLLLGALLFSLASDQSWDWSVGALGHSGDAFFAGNGPSDNFLWKDAPLSVWTVRGFTVLGLFHFGVFISYVYTLISRK